MPNPLINSLSLELPRSLSEQVAEKLQNAIVEGRFAFGENISEEKLASAFGVSRTPVRDALNALQFTGLVEVRPKRGSFVFNPTSREVGQLWEYREILEREACGLAIAKDAAPLVADLRTIIEQMLPAEHAADAQGYARLDARFHLAFFIHCGNVYLRDAYNLGAARIATIITLFARTYSFHRRGSLMEHQSMLSSLEARDLRTFSTTLRTHMQRTLDVAKDHFAA